MNELRQKLAREHEQLEALLKRISEDIKSSDPRDLQKTWGQFEACLTRHLQAEERYLLPMIAASHPDEVRSTLTEHRRIREHVAELGVNIDLHVVRADAVDALTRSLHEHAQSEDRTLYRWAGERASSELVHRL